MEAGIEIVRQNDTSWSVTTLARACVGRLSKSNNPVSPRASVDATQRLTGARHP